MQACSGIESRPPLSQGEGVLTPIPGHDGYFAERDGSIWSNQPLRGHGVRAIHRLRDSQSSNACKHRVVYLKRPGRQPGQKRSVQKYVHSLILLTFVGPCPAGSECRHLDGNVNNNSLGNLCYGTPKENASDRVRHGNQIRGERHYRSRSTEKLVSIIDGLRLRGFTYKKIGKRVGLSGQTVGHIARRETWKHVENRSRHS
jgi:hypothetical protein